MSTHERKMEHWNGAIQTKCGFRRAKRLSVHGWRWCWLACDRWLERRGMSKGETSSWGKHFL